MLKKYYSHGKFEAILNRKTFSKNGINICYDGICFATIYPFLELVSKNPSFTKNFIDAKTIITNNDALILHLSEQIFEMAGNLPFQKDEFRSIILIAREIASNSGKNIFFSKGYYNIFPIIIGDINIEYDYVMNIEHEIIAWRKFFDSEGKEKEQVSPFDKKIKRIFINDYQDFMFNGMCARKNDKITIMSLSEIKQLNDNNIVPKQIINKKDMQHDICYKNEKTTHSHPFFIPSGVKLNVDIISSTTKIHLTEHENKYDGSNINIFYKGDVPKTNSIFSIESSGKHIIMPNITFDSNLNNKNFKVTITNLSSVYDRESFMIFFNTIYRNGGIIDIDFMESMIVSKLFILAYMMKRFNQKDIGELKKAYDKIQFKGTIDEFRQQWKMFTDIEIYVNLIHKNKEYYYSHSYTAGIHKEGVEKIKERIDYTCDLLKESD